MNAFDLGIILTLLVSGALGIYWGIIRQVLSIVGFVTGIVAGGRYGTLAADALSSFIAERVATEVLGFLLVFMLVSAGVSLLASLLHRFVGLLFLGWLDHLIGGLAGLVQGALLCAVFVLAAAAVPNERWSPVLAESRAAPIVASLAGGFLLPWLPDELDMAARMVRGLP
jgi:membrane protein required for colicin V production